MSIVGFQDFWVAGARVYIERDPPSGSSEKQPLLDLGVVQSATPTLAPETLQLDDPDGGFKTKVDELVTTIDETYDVTLNNLNQDNLALLMLSGAPLEFTQVEEVIVPQIYATPGKLVKLVNDDTAATWLYNVDRVIGVYTPANTSTVAVTAVDATAGTITVSSDITGDVSPGDTIILQEDDLANPSSARSYVVASINATTISVVDSTKLAGDESAISGFVRYATGAGVVYKEDEDWDAYSSDRGIVRMIEGGAFATATELVFMMRKAPLTGKRLTKPQSSAGAVQGKMALIYGRSNNEQQWAREARVSITPSALNITADDFSTMTLQIAIISDLSADEVAGRGLEFKGDLPSSS